MSRLNSAAWRQLSEKRQHLIRRVAPSLGSTVVVLLSGLLNVKIAALFIGPEGVGQLAIAQGTNLVVSVLVTLGVNVGVIRAIAARHGRGDTCDNARIRQVSWVINLLTSSVLLAVGVLFRAPLQRLLFPSVEGTTATTLTLLSGVLMGWTFLLLASITAERRTDLFALGNGLGALSTPFVNVAGFAWLGAEGVPYVVLVSSTCSLLAAYLVHRRVETIERHRWRPELDLAIVKELLGIGVPQMLSLLAGISSMMIVPLMVQSQLGEKETGWFRAAYALSAAAGVLITFIVSQEFFPRLAAIAHEPVEFAKAVNQQLRLVGLFTGFMAVAGIVSAPLALRLLYSGKFVEASNTLRWVLAAEFLRLVGLVMINAINASRGTTLTMLVGLATAAGSAALSWALLGPMGAAGAGAATAAAQGAALLVIVPLTLKVTAFRFDRRTHPVLTAETLAVAAVLAIALPRPPYVWLVATSVVAVLVLGFIAAVAIGVAELPWPFNKLHPPGREGHQADADSLELDADGAASPPWSGSEGDGLANPSPTLSHSAPRGITP